MVEQTHGELHFRPLKVHLERCVGDCNTAEDPSGRICIANKEEDLNLREFNTITQYLTYLI